MEITRHRLALDDTAAHRWRPSPNHGGKLEPEYLVIHYTAGRSLEESVSWLGSKASKASAHVVIGRDGTVVQQVAFDRLAWHAGASSGEGRVGLNRWSIGIELDNAGRLTRHGSRWRAWFGDTYDPDDVLEATHKHESEPSGWHVYTPEQLDTALDLATALVERYGLRDIIGHDDISPGRKSDPGPAFPMASFRAGSSAGARTNPSPTAPRPCSTSGRDRGPSTGGSTMAPFPWARESRLSGSRAVGGW